MKYYPVLLDIKGKKCIVIGGGKVAWRKVFSLRKAGGRIWVISPTLTKSLEGLKKKKEILHIKARYQKKYLKGAFLAIAATDNEKINEAVASDAKSGGVLLNVVDSPSLSDFVVPSVMSKKDLIISISTSGNAPCFSKRIRRDLSAILVPEYAKSLSRLKAVRQDLKLRYANPRMRAMALNRLVNAKL